MPTWIVLSRPECSLCDDMIHQLIALLGERAAAVQVRDVTGDADLERRYGQRLPVLLIDDEFVCAYRLDTERLKAFL